MAGIPVPPPRPQRAKPPATKPEPAGNDALLADNRKARFDYEVLETLEAGVNVTIGLPFVRTSVDHGTAFDIAGTGRADERSLIEALRQAVALAPRD